MRTGHFFAPQFLASLLLMAVPLGLGCDDDSEVEEVDSTDEEVATSDGDDGGAGDIGMEVDTSGDAIEDSGDGAGGDAATDGGADIAEDVVEAMNLFDQVWWPMPEEAGITGLLETSSFFSEHSWLITEMSSWFEMTVHERPGNQPMDSSRLGYYAVGNGHVFGFVGTYHPRHTIHGTIGPGYQRHDAGFFSDYEFDLILDGSAMLHEREWIWRPRMAQIPVTRMRAAGTSLELDTVTYAPISAEPGDERFTIVEVLNVRNAGTDDVVDAAVRITPATSPDLVENGFIEEVRAGKALRISPMSEGWVADPRDGGVTGLLSPPFDLEPGEERQYVIVFEFRYAEEPAGQGRAAVLAAGWESLLLQTAQWWRTWHESGLSVTTPDQRVNDLIEGLKGSGLVQITAAGGSCPMSQYTSVWIRDSFGPVRMFLKFGYPGIATGIIDYAYAAALAEGGISNSLEADHEIVEPFPERDWLADIPFGGRLRGEGPSYIPLMHTWIWRYTDDGQRIADRWEYLVHALRGQGITEEGLMYFSGDETFRPQLSFNIGLGPEYAFEDLAYSANSGFLFATAGEALLEYAAETGLESDELSWLEERSGAVRTATDINYWLDEEERYSPFIYMESSLPDEHVAENVNTKPIWLNYLDSDDERLRQNILSSMDQILRNNGLLQNQSHQDYRGLGTLLGINVGDGIMTGMAPAYFLYNVAELNLEIGETTFDAVGSYASPSGNYPEVAIFDEPGMALSIMYARDTMGEVWARHRQWEGAITAEALLHYLVGFEVDTIEGWMALAPHLPHEAPWLEADNMLFLAHRHQLRVESGPDSYELELTIEDDPGDYGLEELRLRLTVAFDGVSVVTVDGEELDTDSYTVSQPYDGSREVQLSLAPDQGMTLISVSGEE